MSRSRPSDTYTRFTSNGPHAAQKPTAPSFSHQHPLQTRSPSSPSYAPYTDPDGETPAQKVARLRMQARAQKMNTLSPVDKFLVRGRRWADNMHRATTYGLLGLAGTSAIVATYGLVSLVGHSRRQKRAFIERELDRLAEAQRAFLRGDANAEQLHLLEQERAGDEMEVQRDREKEKKKTQGIWARVKGRVGALGAAGDMGGETAEEAKVREMRSRGRENVLQQSFVEGEVRPVAVEQTGIQGVGLDAKGRPVPLTKTERVVRKPVEQVPVVGDGAARVTRVAGPLDVLAGNAADLVVPAKSNNGWLSWLRGSSS